MAQPKPSIKTMLHIGKDLGHTTVEECYLQFMSHYDCFFSIEHYAEQYKEFTENMISAGLVKLVGEDNGKKQYQFIDMSPQDALNMIGDKDV